MTSSQSSSAKVGVYMASRTSAGSSFHRSRLSFSPPWLGVETLWTPSASSWRSLDVVRPAPGRVCQGRRHHFVFSFL